MISEKDSIELSLVNARLKQVVKLLKRGIRIIKSDFIEVEKDYYINKNQIISINKKKGNTVILLKTHVIVLDNDKDNEIFNRVINNEDINTYHI